VASDRAVLADLFYTGRDSGLAIRTPVPKGRAGSYYAQTFPLGPDAGPVLFVAEAAPSCGADPLPAFARLDTGRGAHAGRDLRLYLVEDECLDALR
jgi:hypothetical protein